MGCDHHLSCKDCKEKIIIARNENLYRDKRDIDLLEFFLVKHADHDLVFDADDDWVRVDDCKYLDEKRKSFKNYKSFFTHIREAIQIIKRKKS